MSTIKENYIVTKRNILNELRASSMTLQELRFFGIYLAKINPLDVSTRVVRFPIADFQMIMELGSRVKIDYMKNVTNSLLSKIVNVPNERGGYIGFQLFKECVVDKDDAGEWYVEIDAHDRALPLMFEFKNKYFKYPLWNILRLTSSNQIRMYELLKQYERVGECVFTIGKLKELLWIEENEYPRYDNFKRWVLDTCQEALAKNTDICYTYGSYGKRGAGGKILKLKFTITKNVNYADPLALEEFIELQPEQEADYIIDADPAPLNTSRITLLMRACNGEFTADEIEYLDALIAEHYPGDDDAYRYLSAKYKYLTTQKSKIKTSRYGYLRTIVEADMNKAKSAAAERQTKQSKVPEIMPESQEQELARMEKLLERQMRKRGAE